MRRAVALGPRGERLVAVALGALAVVPVLLAAWRSRDWLAATPDQVGIVLRSRDVLTAHTPLIGMPTTLSTSLGTPVHHPGPMGFWPGGLGAAVVDHRAAPMVAHALVNLAAAVGVVGLCRRLFGLVGAAVAGVGVAVVAWSLRDEALVDPWNPYAGVLPLALYLVALVAASRGERIALPIAVLAGSDAAQSHVSLLAPVGAALVAVLVLASVRRVGDEVGASSRRWWSVGDVVRSPAWPSWRGAVIAAGVVAVVAWVPVLVDLLVGSHNAWHLARAGAGTDVGSLGLGGAWKVVAGAVSQPPWTTHGRTGIELVAPVGTARQVFAAVVLLTATGLAVAWRRRRPALARLLVAAVGALLGGALAVSRIPLDPFNLFSTHNYLWLWPVTAVLWAALLAGLVARLLDGERVPGSVRTWAPALAVAVSVLALVFAGVGSSRAPLGVPDPTHRIGPAALALADQLEADLDPGTRYLVDVPDAGDGMFVPMALSLELERRGVEVALPDHLTANVGAHRTDPAGIAARLTVVEPVGDAGELDEPVARFDPAPDDLAAAARADAEVMHLVDAAGGMVIDLGEGPTSLSPSDARQVVQGSGLQDLWRLGAIIEPELPRSLVDRHRTAHERPLTSYAVYVEPFGPG